MSEYQQMCGWPLYDANGQPTALCALEHGTEHSHHAFTAAEAVKLGLAVKLDMEGRAYV